ncbi:acyl-CoA/acyl-ACP dehydrogenase [Sneathiella marina]|uniref:Acyl-CoA/acyl-ACP dehydrogenase n=1 Tax=Sneathiella marina TaxID=2950108 RepID=A0ABY4W0T2_9PROT|nr:acyl-CoA dehydrogenase family protein [Sneathiella marina]USG60735.1 acyl-CoA/acyl-ACP dehydrogenase [Sneathiella marina]
MYFGLSDEQLMIQNSFRGSLERNVTLDSIRRISTGDEPFDGALWQELSGLGMTALLIPEQYGGAALGLIEAVVVAEELGKSAAPVPFVGTAVVAPLAIMLMADETQKSEWLPRLADGSVRIGVAISELASGARRGSGLTEENGTLTGTASFVIDAAGADAFVVADRQQGFHLVGADSPGLEIIHSPTIDGTRPIAELKFQNVQASGLPQTTSDKIDRVLNAGRIILAAESFGAGQEMLRQAVAYAKDRKQFDRAIGSFQAVKHMCAEMAAELQPCQALIWYAAYAFDVMSDDAELSGLLAKSQMDDVGRFVARTATEVHGGMGYTDLMGLHFWFKRIGFNRATWGAPEKLRADAARLQGLG